MSSPDNKSGYREFQSDNNPEMRLEFAEKVETELHPGDHAIHEALVHIGVGYLFGKNYEPSKAWEDLEESAKNLGLLETPTIARIFELKQQTGGLGPLVSELSKATLDYNEAVYNYEHHNVIDEQNARFPRSASNASAAGDVTREELLREKREVEKLSELFESRRDAFESRLSQLAQERVVPTITCQDSRGFKSADQVLSNRMVNHGGREWIMDTSPEPSSTSRTFAFETQEDRDAFVVDLEKRFPGINYSVNLDPAPWAPEDADASDQPPPGAWIAVVKVTGLAV